MKIFCKITSALILYVLLSFHGYAQKLEYEINRPDFRAVYELTSENSIYLKAVYNKDKNHKIDITIDGGKKETIKEDGSWAPHKPCTKHVKVHYRVTGKSSDYIWKKGDKADEWRKAHSEKDNAANAKDKAVMENENKSADETNAVKTSNDVEDNKSVANVAETKNSPEKNDVPRVSNVVKTIPAEQIISVFRESLESDPFYSSKYVRVINEEVRKHEESLSYIKDTESREMYLQNHRLQEYFQNKELTITRMEDGMDSFISDFLMANFNTAELPNSSEYEEQLKTILADKLAERKNIIGDARSKILGDDFATFVTQRLFSGESIVINAVLALLGIFLVILIIRLIRKANKKKKSVPGPRPANTAKTDQPGIVIRRKTTSILKKQSLEDVLHNEAYIPIDCADFCDDSAVRRIYIKNTCIKDIYNMYAEDLRKPDNPNEDGCMVLGRWVHDEQNDEYYVSLEEIVTPGDDAIFKEYELNFGGKIKLKVLEKLKKLRRETNLQYDMTCWVHSHPGLGVFFSNADSSVQMQLKHPTHPKFLVAMVIDILTPNQELGIFTFKHDLSINSKADLKRMYSLDDLHKWAVESERTSFKPADHRNIMQTAAKRIDSHFGIELSNGVVIDMCQLQTSQDNGLLAWVHGYTVKDKGKTEFVLTSISREKVSADHELLGCYVNGSHCSLPTIRRMISNDFSNMKFILFYSTSEDVLTSIPVVDGQLLMDETCYGEVKLEDLKIWTRRKR